MADNKFYTVTKEINGKEYTAQFNGLSCALRMVDSSYIEDSQNISSEKLANYVFKHAIVEPQGLTIDDFDTAEELNAVVAFGRDVLNGNFRDKANTAESKKESK